METRRGDERGAALVEAALILPVILLVTFGAIEFGIGFSQKGGIEAIARSGARTGAAASNDNNAASTPQYPVPNTQLAVEVGQAVNSALATSTLPELNRLYVYKVSSTGVSSGPDSGSCANDCVYFGYDPVQKKFDLSSAQGQWPYSGPLDSGNRILCGVNADRIAVLIQGRFDFFTGLFGSSIPLQAKSVMQLEPNDC